jgi:TonB family protein
MILVSALAALVLQIGVPQNPANRTDYDTFLQGLENQQNARAPGQAVFLKTPGPADLQKVYPPDALAKSLPGQATIHCMVDKTGSFTKCSIVSETPKKSGFGAAALELSKVFKLDTRAAADGTSVVGQGMTIPIKFNP